MNDKNLIRQNLLSQGYPAYETDILYIHNIVHTIKQAQAALISFPHSHEEVPISVVDKGVLR